MQLLNGTSVIHNEPGKKSIESNNKIIWSKIDEKYKKLHGMRWSLVHKNLKEPICISNNENLNRPGYRASKMNEYKDDIDTLNKKLDIV